MASTTKPMTKPRKNGATAVGRPTGRKTPAKPTRRRRPGGWLWGAVAALAVVGVLFAVFRTSNSSGGAAAGHPSYQVGSPGIGAAAPGFALPASTGGQISLAGLRGKTVLLYFQEGLGCEPCWTQMQDLEKQAAAVKAAGVDAIVSITTQPVKLLAQKASDERISTPVLADTSLTVSKAYDANKYGMMGDGMDGHSFVLVGPDGRIQWRGDYGGAPKYTMYVPPAQLLADLKAGRRA